jgi:hypothetical protein
VNTEPGGTDADRRNENTDDDYREPRISTWRPYRRGGTRDNWRPPNLVWRNGIALRAFAMGLVRSHDFIGDGLRPGSHRLVFRRLRRRFEICV